MVAKIASGKSIRGALSYNENKREEGKAVLIDAHLYPKDKGQLSYYEKLNVLQQQADLHTREHKCVHISLNFDRTDFDQSEDSLRNDEIQAIHNAQLLEIATAYMHKIGYGEQPFLVYRHKDAAHPHVHIVTTSVRSDGSPIKLHNNWEASEKARKEIEQEFSLVPAESRKRQELRLLKPADLEKAEYGKSPTKATISNIVRTVVRYYKFASLHELNAVLSQFNVIADRGEPGTLMNENNGLVYSLLGPNNKKIGIPIKASSIYEEPKRPILKHLEEKFAKNDPEKKEHREAVCAIIDSVLDKETDMNRFLQQLQSKGIFTVLRQNKDGHVYGITYVDNNSCCVFNGSDLHWDKRYAAKGIADRMRANQEDEEKLSNKKLVEDTIATTSFPQNIKAVLTGWAVKGVLVHASKDDQGNILYSMGHYAGDTSHYHYVTPKMARYLLVNGLTEELTSYIRTRFLESFFKHAGSVFDNIHEIVSTKAEENFAGIIEDCFRALPTDDYISSELLKEAKKKKRKRGR
jgi:hypothetical protein